MPVPCFMFMHCSHGNAVAVKIIKVQLGPQADDAALTRFRHEVDCHRRLSNHRNIVRFVGVCNEFTQDRESVLLAIVMEWAPLGSLFEMLGGVGDVWAMHGCVDMKQSTHRVGRCTS